ncbi:MAG: lamin tail domain-containing protein [Anaerolineaceae bacterium]|nr:lamin tail domain-containing protein [Anaerolineaceae bacterium]
MNNRKKLFLYILINIMISALTVLCVLYFWERAHSPINVLPISDTQKSPDSNQISNGPIQTQENVIQELDENTEISIEGVFGIGQGDIEHVSVRNIGDVAVDLYYCRLLNGRGDEYLFPEIILNQEGAVSVFTKAGNNTVLELYWGKSESLWKSGDLATLLDQNGNILSTYQIP